MYGSETMLWKKKKRSRIGLYRWTTSEDCLVLGGQIVPNAHIRELCGVMKGVEKRINENVLRWFGHVERMERDRIAKRAYVGECAGSHSVGRPWNRWIDTVKDCLRKRGLGVRQARRMLYDKN